MTHIWGWNFAGTSVTCVTASQMFKINGLLVDGL